MKYQIPATLHRGDTIGIVAPSSPEKNFGRVEQGVKYLSARGYHVQLGSHVNAQNGFLAGSDGQRAEDVSAMFADKNINAIFCTRGGYGSARMLPMLDWKMIARNPKIFCGFSDGTALNLALLAQAQLASFTGALPGVDFWKARVDPFTEKHFWNAITGKKISPMKCKSHDRKKSADGILVGGNLSIVASLVGTPFLPDIKKSVWVLEDVSEEPYRIDRMLNQLLLAGVFRNAAAVVFGEFAHCEAEEKKSQTVREVIDDFSARVACPVFTGLRYGHVSKKLTLQLGRRVRVENNFVDFV